MAHRGKIACHFPERGNAGLNPNFDVTEIKFTKDGTEVNLQNIDKVYYLPPGTQVSSVADLAQYLIWELVNDRKLVDGELTVCIEFVPSADIQLSSLAIFSADSESSTTVNCGIIHESGLVVFLSNTDNIDMNVTKYELTGERRYIQSISNVTLKKDFKYYIHYTNGNNTFKPAYFQNETGNYVNWNHGTLQSKSVANINTARSYLGEVSDAAVWLAANENDFMISEIGQGGLNNSDAYIRNNVCNNASIIGQNQQTLPATEKDKLLKLNVGDGFMYIGNDYTESTVTVLKNQNIYTKNNTLDNSKYKGIKTTAKGILDDLNKNDYCLYNGTTVSQIVSQNHIYEKIADLDVGADLDLTSYSSDLSKMMAIISSTTSQTPYINVAIKQGGIGYTDYTGYVFKLKSIYTKDFGPGDAGYTCSNVPYVDNTIYYITDQGQVTGGYIWTAGLWFYDSQASNDKWVLVGANGQNLVLSYFDITTFADAIQEVMLAGSSTLVGQLSDLAKTHYNGDYISNTIKSQTVLTDRKYYLEINGREV
jgi:hypothetical protein